MVFDPMKDVSCDMEKLKEWRRFEELQIFLQENQKRIDQGAKTLQEENQSMAAKKLNYDALLFCPHDLEGKEVELDASAFEVIESWALLSGVHREKILGIVRSATGNGCMHS